MGITLKTPPPPLQGHYPISDPPNRSSPSKTAPWSVPFCYFRGAGVLPAPDGTSFTLTWPEIRLLGVAPAARGQGVGAALVRECMRRSRRSGAAAVTLHTTDMMAVAIRMYERMGFVRAPELDFEPAPGFTIKGYRYRFNDGS